MFPLKYFIAGYSTEGINQPPLLCPLYCITCIINRFSVQQNTHLFMVLIHLLMRLNSSSEVEPIKNTLWIFPSPTWPRIGTASKCNTVEQKWLQPYIHQQYSQTHFVRDIFDSIQFLGIFFINREKDMEVAIPNMAHHWTWNCCKWTDMQANTQQRTHAHANTHARIKPVSIFIHLSRNIV